MSADRASVNVLGVPVQAWQPDELIDAIVRTVMPAPQESRPRLSTIHYANVHVLNTACRDDTLRRELRRASAVYCDGSGVVLAARLLGRQLPPRLTAADWIDAFCRRAASEGLRLFLIGGAEGVAAKAAAELSRRHPALRIAGTYHGHIDPDESRRVVSAANQSGADVILVGMGTPAQELWIADHRHELDAACVWSVGGLFDFLAGVQRLAPRWIGKLHLEWLWRLGTDPVRLAGRYVIGNPLFALRVLGQHWSQPKRRV